MIHDDGRVMYTQSELSTFKRCKRKWYLNYFRRLTPLEARDRTGALRIGTLVHLGMQGHNERKEDPLVLMRTMHEQNLIDIGEFDLFGLERAEKEYKLASIMVEGYLEWLEETGNDATYEIVGVEQAVEVIVFDDVWLRGKLDLRVRDAFGQKWFRDYKTVGTFKVPHLTLDEQMLQYHLLELITEGDQICHGGEYEMLRKVKRTATAKPPFYMRLRIEHNKFEIESYRLRIKGIHDEIVRVSELLERGDDHRQVAPPTPKQTCSWDCEHFKICRMFDDGSHVEQLLQDLYVSYNPEERYVLHAEDEEDG